MLAKYYLSSLALLLLTLLTVLAPRQADAAAATHFVVSAPSAATAGTTFSVTVTT